jgi:acetoin utilization protein AcuB
MGNVVHIFGKWRYKANKLVILQANSTLHFPMLAKELISEEIRPLQISDSALSALHWMDELRRDCLPVVDNGQYLGMISEDAIFSLGNFEEPISKLSLNKTGTTVLQDQHIYEVIRVAASQKQSIVPVVDEAGIYLGAITQQKLIGFVALMAGVENPGGIIIIETGQNDYSLSEIAKIVESEEARVISAHVATPLGSSYVEVTLKLNRMDIQQIVQSLDRHGFKIKASYYETDYFDNLHDRYNSLMNFLNI